MFVCTGNICRSAMAEVIFKDIVDDVDVSSAGISTVSGKSATREAIEVCRKHGLDLTGHRSTYIKDSSIGEMDLVLTATDYHSQFLRKSYPDLNIQTIKEYAGYGDVDIADPYGYPLNVYEDCFLEIKEALEKIVEIREF